MSNLFHPDSKFSEITHLALDYVKLGLLFMIFSIPILTSGAAATAVLSVAMKIERGEAPAIWQPFWKSFRENFRQSLGLTLLFGALLGLLAFDWYMVMQMESTLLVRIVRAGLVLLAMLWVIVSLYSFANLARYRLGNRQIIKNAVVFSITNFRRNVVVLLIFLSGLLLYVYVPSMIPVVTFVFPALEIFYLAKISVQQFDRLEERSCMEAFGNR